MLFHPQTTVFSVSRYRNLDRAKIERLFIVVISRFKVFFFFDTLLPGTELEIEDVIIVQNPQKSIGNIFFTFDKCIFKKGAFCGVC